MFLRGRVAGSGTTVVVTACVRTILASIVSPAAKNYPR
jgi:hypothetical protein